MQRIFSPCLAFVLAFLPAAVFGQQVNGRVLDALLRHPVAGAEVRLLRGDSVLTTVLASRTGTFSLHPPIAGVYTVAVTAFGHGSWTADVAVSRTSPTALTVLLEVQPISLPSVEAAAPRDERLERFGFYRRQEQHGKAGRADGVFLMAEEIIAQSPFYLTDVLRSIPGSRSHSIGRYETGVVFGTGCVPKIYLNGTNYGLPINEIVSPYQIVAMEVYPRVHIDPTGFMVGPGCSVVIWAGPTARK